MKFLQENTLPKQIKTFFAEVNIPLNIISDELPTNVAGILGEEHPRAEELNALISDIYVLGIIDDSVFHNAPTHWTSVKIHAIQKEYDGLLVMGVKLKTEKPTRKQLSDISRIFNRTFPYMPLLIVFEYGKMLAFANHERVPYHKIAKWREGEKIGKVSLLKDIDKQNPHSGHLRILDALKIAANVRTFADLYVYWQDVLSISTLNKEFYQKLFNWYLWALQEVKFPQIRPEKDKVANEVHQSESLIRLLTRLLFVWFMKEKGLISKDLFDKDILSHILIKDFGAERGEKTIYYKAILQNLFFATLNRPIQERNQVKKTPFLNAAQYGDTLLYRFGDLFQDSEHFVEHFANVPFLNGGLFDCLDQKKDDKQTEEIRLDGFSSVAKKQVVMPDKLFFGEHKVVLKEGVEEKTKKKENALFEEDSKYKTTVYGLIDILHQYKFTIEENTPLEEEIALDPELLGKVFENLLASYNPETQSTARKQTGSFYTPREIVDYMVEESLVAYLLPKIADYQELKKLQNPNEASAEEKLRTLLAFSNEMNPFDAAETVHLLNAINECKILDPACGSGAFPMGVLQKMIFILQKLDPQNKIWLELMLQNVPSTLRAKMKEKLENENLDYARKLGIIQECIYGIDIQPIATQIAKLRFFISLLVDQKGDPQKENLGFDPLPNLDFKIVTANSLIAAPKNELIEKAGYVENSLKTFEQLTHDYFNAHIPSEKQKLKQEISACIQSIVAANEKVITQWADKVRKENNSASPAQKKKNAAMLATFERDLAQWESYENLFKHEAVGFFETKYFFPQVKKGFDLVIGNPPYVKEYSNKAAFDGIRNTEHYQGKMDLWYAFATKGFDFLKAQTGLLCFIATNNWVTNSGASIMRNKIIQEATIEKLIDFGAYMIFESADIQTMIMLFRNEKKDKPYSFDYRKINMQMPTFQEVIAILNKKENVHLQYFSPIIDKEKLKNSLLHFGGSMTEKILEHIKMQQNFVLDGKEVANGIHPHYDYIRKKMQLILGNRFKVGEGIFVLSQAEKESLGATEAELTLLKPYYTTEQLGYYYGDRQNKEWIIYTDSSFKNPANISPYPHIKAHLDKFQTVITSDNKPYGLHRARDERFFKGEKIIALRKCANYPIFTYTDFDCYVSATFYIIKTERINQKYLTALLNSTLMDFWLKHKGKMQGNHYQIDKEPLLGLPIKQIANTIAFERLVEYILFLMKNGDVKNNAKNGVMVSYFKSILNAMVFEIYFEETVRNSKKEVLSYLNDLPLLASTISQTQEWAMVKAVFELLHDSKHPVRSATYYLDSMAEYEFIKKSIQNKV